jgi:uncharacterized protein YerC
MKAYFLLTNAVVFELIGSDAISVFDTTITSGSARTHHSSATNAIQFRHRQRPCIIYGNDKYKTVFQVLN